MRRFLEAHPRMDFVADTRLPWATVSRAMESEWERIKALREQVGLEPNQQPARKREWKKQLEIYDVYFPHWLKNRKRIAALPQIWRENLGFQEAFKLLGVELTPEATNLAGELDKRGLKPKGVFKFVDKFLRNRETASYVEAATRGMSANSKPKRSSRANGVFDAQGYRVAVVEFDYDAVDALLDGCEALDNEPDVSPKLSEANLTTLQSWRTHFSILKPQLPTSLTEMSANKRREWFRITRQRIESLWPSKDYYDEI